MDGILQRSAVTGMSETGRWDGFSQPLNENESGAFNMITGVAGDKERVAISETQSVNQSDTCSMIFLSPKKTSI
jgi:hypothetical protein